MTQVKWGFMQFKADPEKVWREIQQIGDQYTPQDVLEYARDPQTELHKCFDWDNTTAAEKWRKQQARWVCNSLVVEIEQTKHSFKEYRIIQHDREDMVYRPVTYTIKDEDQYKRLVRRAMQELKAWKDRYKEIVELKNVIEEIERIIK